MQEYPSVNSQNKTFKSQICLGSSALANPCLISALHVLIKKICRINFLIVSGKTGKCFFSLSLVCNSRSQSTTETYNWISSKKSHFIIAVLRQKTIAWFVSHAEKYLLITLLFSSHGLTSSGEDILILFCVKWINLIIIVQVGDLFLKYLNTMYWSPLENTFFCLT